MNTYFSNLQAETAGDEAELSAPLAGLNNLDTYSFLTLVAIQAIGPMVYETKFRTNWIVEGYRDLDGVVQYWNNPFYNSNWDDFAAQPNKMRLALQASNELGRPYMILAWWMMSIGHLVIFGLPLALTTLALFTQGASAA